MWLTTTTKNIYTNWLIIYSNMYVVSLNLQWYLVGQNSQFDDVRLSSGIYKPNNESINVD